MIDFFEIDRLISVMKLRTKKNKQKKSQSFLCQTDLDLPDENSWICARIICVIFFMSCVCHAFASVHCCLVVTCWEKTDFLALVMWYPGSGVVLDCIHY